jgi:hypothetical protein
MVMVVHVDDFKVQPLATFGLSVVVLKPKHVWTLGYIDAIGCFTRFIHSLLQRAVSSRLFLAPRHMYLLDKEK